MDGLGVDVVEIRHGSDQPAGAIRIDIPAPRDHVALQQRDTPGCPHRAAGRVDLLGGEAVAAPRIPIGDDQFGHTARDEPGLVLVVIVVCDVHAVRGPHRGAEGVHLLRVDIPVAVPLILPADRRVAGRDVDDVGVALVVRGGADPQPGPPLWGAAAVDPVDEHFTVAHGAVVPDNIRAARAVVGNRGAGRSHGRHGGHGDAVVQPEAARPVDPLHANVEIAHRRDDRATGAVGVYARL